MKRVGRPPLDPSDPSVPDQELELKPNWWHGMIQSEIEKVVVARGYRPARERKYRGGLPSPRLRQLQGHHELRARQAGVSWDFVDLRHVYAKGEGKCGICNEPLALEEFTVDHIVPMSKGGAHLLDNLQPAHRSCNSKKGDK